MSQNAYNRLRSQRDFLESLLAVLPEHQGRGLGKMIMAAISDYIAREVPESGYVSLIADGEAYRLYQQFGFALTAPASQGMALKKTAG